jgi:15-cis-phytoene synthase
MAPTVAQAHVTMAVHSKSFAMAARVFPAATRDDAAVIYSYCRYVDDAVDNADGSDQQQRAMQRLRAELDLVFNALPESTINIELTQLRRVINQHRIPRLYFDELLRGMQLDVEHRPYQTVDQLIDYCYCVASVVGLIMCHIMGVRHWRTEKAQRTTLQQAAHLGIAMQLTNICRDVAEDFQLGRQYLPEQLLMSPPAGGGFTLSETNAKKISPAVEDLLQLAERYYRSGQRGARALPWRSAFAVRAARHIYSAIGKRVAATGFNVLAGRAVVSKARKLAYVALALWQTVADTPWRLWQRWSQGKFAAPMYTLEAHHVDRL